MRCGCLSAAAKAVSERFVINAGGLRVAATLASGEALADNLVAFNLLGTDAIVGIQS